MRNPFHLVDFIIDTGPLAVYIEIDNAGANPMLATAPEIDARYARGQAIADTMKLERQQVTYGEYWLVPSSIAGQYAVHIKHTGTTCSCPDFEKRQLPCKHVHAVEITKTRQQNADGSVTETETVTVTKRTLPQAEQR